MKSKRLNWKYDTDFFSKKSDIAEKVFKESSPKIQSPDSNIRHQIDLGLLDYDIEYYDTLRDVIIIPANESTGIPRLITFTSSDFGEGVSTIVSKLAVTFAKSSDGPVLIVDSNFAKPSIHKIFGVSLSPGLGEILINGNEKDVFIQPSPINNLFILSAGDIISNPTSKFDSPMFYELLRKWKSDYKFVLFDTPPMQCDMKQCDMNSSVRLASLVDGVVLVIESESIRREVAQNIKERLVDSKANILGVVLNKTKHYIPGWLYKRL